MRLATRISIALEADTTPVATPCHGALASALVATDVNVFRHEFGTIFRYAHRATLHPADLHVLALVDARCTLYEPDNGTVFLARDVVAQLQRLAAASKGVVMRRPQRHAPQSRPSRALRIAKWA